MMHKMFNVSGLLFAITVMSACGGLLNIAEDYVDCGSPNGGTLCRVDGQHCVNGMCVWEDERCSPAYPEGPCAPGPDGKDRSCIAGACVSDPEQCSLAYPLGVCPESQTCIYGECVSTDDQQPCNSENIRGYCDAGHMCFDGTCYPVDNDEVCSENNQTGICQAGYRCVEGICLIIPYSERCSSISPEGFCDAWEVCLDGQCTDPIPPDACFPSHPDGRCPAGEVCVAGYCQVIADNPCAPERPVGLCPPGYSCDGGECVPVSDEPCSKEYPQGLCEQGQRCDFGVCVWIVCSEKYPYGVCSEDSQMCQDGQCLDVQCSVEYPHGVCAQDMYCLDGICIFYECSVSHPTGICPQGQECVEGHCQNFECSSEHPRGGCPDPLQICINDTSLAEHGTCTWACSDSYTDGYCTDSYDCIAGDCYAPCASGIRCGVSYNCCRAGEICTQGVCAPPEACEPNQLFCVDSLTVALCDITGLSYSDEVTCQLGCNDTVSPVSCSCVEHINCEESEYCSGTACVDDVCPQEQLFCASTVELAMCDDEGSSYTTQTVCKDSCDTAADPAACTCLSSGDADCEGDEFCGLDGHCQADLCPEGQYFCSYDELYLCSENGDGMTYQESCSVGCGTTAYGEGCLCQDDWDCPTNQSCEVDVCLGSPQECRLPAKAFSETLPRIEIQWGGANRSNRNAYGSPFIDYAQAVMVPVVINLDDDNGDGLVNERDFPEIVFTVLHQSDFYYNGVLRAIHAGGPDKGMDYFAACGENKLWQAPICGDGVCEYRETHVNCEDDCIETCGNGVIDSGEAATDCAVDHMFYLLQDCGDAVCQPWETGATCANDCMFYYAGNWYDTCNDGAQQLLWETAETCPDDFGITIPMPAQVCGDGTCDSGIEDTEVCPEGKCRDLCGVDCDMKNCAESEADIDSTANIAAGDIDGDGIPEIAVILRDESSSANLYLRLYNNKGEILLTDWAHPMTTDIRNGSPSIADLDNQKPAEVIIGNYVWRFTVEDKNWSVDHRYNYSSGYHGRGYVGEASCVADIVGNGGRPQIIAGTMVYAMPREGSATYDGSELDFVMESVRDVTELYSGTLGGGASTRNTLYVQSVNWSNNLYNGDRIRITSGPYKGFHRTISDTYSNYLELSSDMPDVLADGTSFVIYEYSGDTNIDGFCAVADILGANGTAPQKYGTPIALDGEPEVIVVAYTGGPNIIIFSGRTGEEFMRVAPVGAGGDGGAPNVADFDKDGFPEIGYADTYQYFMIDVQPQSDCDTVNDPGCSCPAWNTCADGSMTDTPLLANPGQDRSPSCTYNGWCSLTQDGSSRSTGSSVFDLNGDGAVEVIYNDECYFRVYDGLSGHIHYMTGSSSRTRSEYPVIADADNDGNAEIIFVTSNESNFCGSQGGDYEIDENSNNGIEMWGDPSDAWVTSRRIWNQHTYHMTNVTESGGIPLVETDNWTYENSYRRNRQSAITGIPAPDLYAAEGSIAGQGGLCGSISETSVIDINVKVSNRGELRVGPGVKVSFTGTWPGPVVEYLLDSNGDYLVAEVTNTIDPGRYVYVTATFDPANNPAGVLPESIEAYIDDAAVGSNESECNEMNNITDPIPVESGQSLAELQIQIDNFDTSDCYCSIPNVTITVSNTGSLAATNVPVTFYAGDPDQFGEAIHTITIPAINAGESVQRSNIVLNGGAGLSGFPINRTIQLYVVVNRDAVTNEPVVIECNYANNEDSWGNRTCVCGG